MEMRVAYTRVEVKNILYATDFSRFSVGAFPYALALARKFGSKVFAVHVIPTPAYPHPPLEGWEQMTAQAKLEADEEMARLDPKWMDIPHESVIRRGDLWPELSAFIQKNEIDMIVVGTRGRGGMTKALMGSVAEKIFRQAPCPVLTVGPNVTVEPGSVADLRAVLYPTDFSEESLAAAPFAISLAQENQSRLYLLHVAENPVNKLVEAKLKTRLLDLIPPEAELWCEAKARVESGNPAEQVLRLAEELALDLIVLGVKRTPRMGGLSTHLPMATASSIVSRAACPVLTVRG
jgi:nucleotide-binding universal stress UspA family protein